jgi:hypothetical protein
VTNYQYFTGVYNTGAGTSGAWYYFESRTENRGHSIEASTTLSHYYEPISIAEPGIGGLFGAALASMSFLQRKTSALLKMTKYKVAPIGAFLSVE